MYNCILKGNHLVWNTEFAEAKKYLDPLAKSIPRMAYELAIIPILGSVLSGDTSLRDESLKAIEAAEHSLYLFNKHSATNLTNLIQELERMDEELYSNNENYYNFNEKDHKNFCQLKELTIDQKINNLKLDHEILDGELHLMRGVVQFSSGSYFKGFYNLRKSYLKFKHVYNIVEPLKSYEKSSNEFIHSDVLHNVYFGMGIFNFMLSILPPMLTSILSMIGFDADRDHGLELMKFDHEYGGRQFGVASFMLSMNYLFIPRALEDRETKLAIAGGLLEKSEKIFPRSGGFKMMKSHYERKKGDISNAITSLSEAITICEESMGFMPNILVHELSWCYFLTEDFEKASHYLNILVSSEKDFDTKGISAMLLAACKLRLGDIEGTNKLIDSFGKYVSKGSRIDKFAAEKVEVFKYLKTEKEKHLMMFMSVFHFLYVKRDLANLQIDIAEPLYELFIKTSNEIVIDNHSKLGNDIQAGLAVVRGQFLRLLGKHEESKEEFKKAVSYEHHIVLEKQWIAFSYYEIGESIYLFESKQVPAEKKEEKLALLKDVKHYLEKCSKMSGYSFEEVLHSRAKLALKQVNKEISELSHH
ncbi:predicted protein [Naegleria gruberi]|uniref:Predicted protein n=1 Tax=Naegleria gruberi TaxID=5762 RepID=D2V1D3_NAEGR|nr:uncharacterized protein NAEGRDRAFT_62539 [Naegleria gruberi]EFC49286.1 predicted protein [Naegleria gruberi]|eukprot:XP_002682030.1 predicted protein [Naegleria gruberi strain NEG-M]